ncbi:hypothetical protein SD70_13495 [Gordoniibacillus kamchatkensis]|uniref:DNA-binding response regulator n=1 Tax=Gordoniibacillus kamchatkensis TaxID=1590651 RepID=A0ABR5AH94_9BACL|nr:response regulator [Paenibacillus sp. VKM B-2647]KIL40426.1 hypothetical protein SD70_13495 [Paenibacillus sp. VKM B-2647]
MYKILIVDDEEEIREGIRDIIPWPELSFEFAGEAENGVEGLKMCAMVQPDVVLCDINMPVMNGFELTEEIVRLYPQIKVIVLTGYDYFEYAQHAIKLNVYDYVLKPITPDEMMQLLVKVKQDLDHERLAEETAAQIKEQLEMSIPLLRERYLNLWIIGKLEPEELDARLSSVHAQLSGDLWSVLVLDLEQQHLSRFVPGEELLHFALTNIIKECVHQAGFTGEPFVSPKYQLVLITAIAGDDLPSMKWKFQELSETVRLETERFLNVPIAVGLGFVGSRTEVPHMYASALRALDYRFIMGIDQVLYIEDLERRETYSAAVSDTISLLRDEIVKQLRIASKQDMKQLLDGYFGELQKAGIERELSIVHVIELVSLLSKEYYESSHTRSEAENGDLHPITQILRFSTLDQIKAWLVEWCMKVISRLSENREDASAQIVNEAIQYIEANHANIDLSIQLLCEHLHVSQSYFCYLFKKQTGSTFLEYLTRTRIDKAKVLLRTTNKKNYEVAEEIGFGNVHYFSVVFKKVTGVTSSEYRTQT